MCYTKLKAATTTLYTPPTAGAKEIGPDTEFFMRESVAGDHIVHLYYRGKQLTPLFKVIVLDKACVSGAGQRHPLITLASERAIIERIHQNETVWQRELGATLTRYVMRRRWNEKAAAEKATAGRAAWEERLAAGKRSIRPPC
eukprot:3619255-Prymnesium_polylepis.1